MKVLMLGWELPPHYVGGMGIVCEQLSKQMADLGADIEFILPFEADFSHVKHMKVKAAIDQDATTLMKSGGTYDSTMYHIVKKGGKKNQRNLYEQVEAYAQNIHHILKYGSYDIIHAHDWLTFRAGIEAKRASGLPLFLHVHATEYDRAGTEYGNPLIRDIEYVGFRMADHIFAISNRIKRILIEQYDVPPEKISIAHNIMEVTKELLAEEDETYIYLQEMRRRGYGVVVNAGRMTIQKGLYFLLMAARKVVDVNPKTLFLFVGGGEQIPELLELSASLGLSGNVIFTGRVEGINRQWRDCFRASDLYVMPSVSEPFGMVPLEAIVYGAPTLISKQSGIAECLTHTLKVDHWNVDEIANQISNVLSHRELHDALLKNAQEEHRKMTWEPTSRHILDRYREHAGKQHSKAVAA